MPKIKMPKSAPSIDMTPMVDLAFLLVTFFMLSANFRTDEPVTVSTPSSISDKEVPNKRLIMVTINQDGFIYFNATGERVRERMLKDMAAKYKTPIDQELMDEFKKISSFGCSMSQLPQYLKLSSKERQSLKGWEVPADSSHNELKDWIYYAYAASLAQSREDLKEDTEKHPSEKPNADDYKPKFVLKVDGKAHYAQAKRAIDTFRDLDINNLYFVTSLEEDPNKRNHE
jgi:biopolymer transport protein ExbD